MIIGFGLFFFLMLSKASLVLAGSNLESYPGKVVEIVNSERRERGLRALVMNETLTEAALERACEIRSRFSHTRPSGKPWNTILQKYHVSWRNCGENIAKGNAKRNPQGIMNLWMNSSGHRQNILSPKYTQIGVGVCRKNDGNLYWVQIFIR